MSVIKLYLRNTKEHMVKGFPEYPGRHEHTGLCRITLHSEF